MRRVIKLLAAVLAVYLAACAGLYTIMTLPSERFARAADKMPSTLLFTV
jgi:hypothetical protein